MALNHPLKKMYQNRDILCIQKTDKQFDVCDKLGSTISQHGSHLAQQVHYRKRFRGYICPALQWQIENLFRRNQAPFLFYSYRSSELPWGGESNTNHISRSGFCLLANWVCQSWTGGCFRESITNAEFANFSQVNTIYSQAFVFLCVYRISMCG